MFTKHALKKIVLVGGALLLLVTAALADELFSVGIDSKAPLVAGNTAAVVSGTVSCATGDTLLVSAVINQASGNVIAQGSGSNQNLNVCNGPEQPWSVTATAFSGTFKNGPAGVTVNVEACNQTTFQCDYQQITVRIHLG